MNRTLASTIGRRCVIPLALVGALALAGCGDDETVPAASPIESVPGGSSSAGSDPTVPATTGPVAAVPVEIAGVYENVGFYPACGNETLRHDGVTWYPLVHAGFDAFDPDLEARVDAVFAVEREDSPVVGVRGFARVAPPGPGDDNGTLVIWADGVARWVSDSKVLDVWMIDEEIVYNWVC